ncbi:MAG: hypothetical protein SFU91_13210 [Chloroherpetonaceae bacterium]|nr:hypothetical protein [Chloroherpetonaceae bacterium]
MKTLLQTAFEEAQKLPSEEQNRIAEFILEELKSNTIWDDKFHNTKSELSNWAKLVRKEIRDGKITKKGIDEI